MRRTLGWVAAAGLLLVPGLAILSSSPAAASSGYINPLNYGAPAAPQSIVPGDLDVQIHKRSPGDSMDVMDAGHGADCSAPPATHSINTLAQGVYACKNHLMTAINAGDYGEIALTPPELVDFSGGQAQIQVSVSTLQFCTLDWIELWVSPFSENITLPHSGTVDLQGPPKDALRFHLSDSGDLGASTGQVYRFDNFAETSIPRQLTTSLASLVAASGVVRTTFEIDLSTTHVRFGVPGLGAGGTWWTDTAIAPLAFNQGIVQLVHHSYNVAKHCPGSPADTWHWSGLSLSSAVPFTLINGAQRAISATDGTTVDFARPAPAGAFLRFSGLGTISVSYDGGKSWQAAQEQVQRDHATDHFSSYWTPIPAGVQRVLFSGVHWYGGPWWVRDPSIWSLSTSPPQSPPSRSGSGGGGGPQPVNPPAASAHQPANPPVGQSPSESGGSGSTVHEGTATFTAHDLVTQLAAAVNPNQDPVITVLLVSLLAGALVAIARAVRG